MSKMIIPFTLGFFIGWGCFWSLFVIRTAKANSRVHVLEKPLKITFKDEQKSTVLPPTTWLHYDRSFPEGYTRYRVYVNIEGPPLKHQKTEYGRIKAAWALNTE